MTIEANRVTEPTPFPPPPEWLVFEPWDTANMKWWSIEEFWSEDAARKACKKPGAFVVRVNHKPTKDAK